MKNLLSQTHNLIKHHRELEIQKGEKFNVFSILQVESKEQKKISEFSTRLDTSISRIEDQINQAQTWKKGLLQQMFI